VRRLIAALEGLRANLGVVIADLEADDKASALQGLAKAERQFRRALKELRS
jgi:hypothetical protein